MRNPTKRARFRLRLRTFLALIGVASMASTVGATTQGPVDSAGARQVLETRVLAVRAAISRVPEPKAPDEHLGTLAQWYNWNNWNNWGNWGKWNNWGNWPNWANWPNWFNR